MNAGHEVMLTDSWLAQCYWSDKTKCQGASSVGVQLNGNDHLLSNVIVFDYATVVSHTSALEPRPGGQPLGRRRHPVGGGRGWK